MIILLIDYKKGVVIYAPFKFFFYEGFQFAGVSFDIAFSLVVCILFFSKRKTISVSETFPWKKSFAVLTISGIIFSFYPVFYMGELLRQIFCIYGYAYIFFCVLSDKQITVTFVSSCAFFTFLLAGNGFVQLLTDVNILGNFHNQFYNAEFGENSLVRFGNFGRIRSFCSHSISYGVECVVFSMLFVYLFLHYNKILFKKKYYVIVLLGLIGVITSGSRTPLIGMVIMTIPFILTLGKLESSKKIILLSAMLVFCFVFGTYIVQMINSIVNPDASSVEGSNTEGRLEQFAYSIYLVRDNWLLGYGNVNIMDMKNFDYRILYGAESIWMVTLLQKGLIGIIAYVYFYVDVFTHLPKSNKIAYSFFVIGWLIIDSATSLMGINMFLPIMIITLLYKLGTNDKLIKNGAVKYSHTSL